MTSHAEKIRSSTPPRSWNDALADLQAAIDDSWDYSTSHQELRDYAMVNAKAALKLVMNKLSPENADLSLLPKVMVGVTYDVSGVYSNNGVPTRCAVIEEKRKHASWWPRSKKRELNVKNYDDTLHITFPLPRNERDEVTAADQQARSTLLTLIAHTIPGASVNNTKTPTSVTLRVSDLQNTINSIKPSAAIINAYAPTDDDYRAAGIKPSQSRG